MDKLGFQIRPETHPFGGLWLTSNGDGDVVLETDDGTTVNLGTGEDAYLVAKCIEVEAKWKVSEEFEEATRERLQETLEQVKADHQNIKSEP